MSTTTDSNRVIVLVLGALAALVLLPALFMGMGLLGFGGMMGYGGMMGPMYGGAGDGTFPAWMAIVAVVSQLLFFALLVGGGYLLYRAVSGDGRDPALDELRAAYARGDLSDEEFDRRRERLSREH